MSASNNDSVIGVACRYREFGSDAKIAAATRAATFDPLACRTSHATAPVATLKDRMESATADIPLR
jgi:hypothetical protein